MWVHVLPGEDRVPSLPSPPRTAVGCARGERREQLHLHPATKEQAKARIALTGPTGSGKTYSALVIGTGIGDRIALIDTEHGSASKYADEFAFDTLPLATFEPRARRGARGGRPRGLRRRDRRLAHALLVRLGGMLEQVDNAAKRVAGGNTFAGWREARPWSGR
ncbi:AAA family ATPase [Streptomyces sp. INA 01156]